MTATRPGGETFLGVLTLGDDTSFLMIRDLAMGAESGEWSEEVGSRSEEFRKKLFAFGSEVSSIVAAASPR